MEFDPDLRVRRTVNLDDNSKKGRWVSDSASLFLRPASFLPRSYLRDILPAKSGSDTVAKK
jgi:hypothetical protein